LAIVLLYTSGLRRGELVRLTLGDYDFEERTLHIRDTKFHKSRLVPLSRQAAHEINRYLRARRRLSHAADAPLLCTRHHGLRPYTGTGLAQGLRRLFEHAEVRTARGLLPRIHDLRHTFALEALRRWYREGVDVQSKLPALAAYMGHVSIISTQYYLALLEPFSATIGERFDRHCAAFLGTSAAAGGVP
jgi:integrase